ncbi:MAG TPA: chemotaxis-specific protein-glutamate methyltransferase CheB [bacterium]|jgi:two-component system chemotaxis response regulator CheB|nr:chemotaxis-specific protein-glutamate methyltransferase CheB [bacterium]MDX9804562.1 chemotaxis-specific protein-glutamate methyltransferase CheB [bacterium]HNW15415.1 chemotaxis-specific protein-glutamate methyltransferase CheB [bacterium]HNZ52880.1 chemotaxis-specific protein-glutamate methyltransferase CheB [bacterium]HOB72100.1 chemotaxis-specific protein-glutamate methyltransferase CheB [bacterium]
MTGKKRVLIVDDSRTAREVLAEIISGFEDFEVAGKASDPFEAHDFMKKEMPDIVTLDIEMPKMDGLTFLDKIMRGAPLPVIMISSLTTENAAFTLKALELGAVDYVLKPGGDESLKDVAQIIHEKLVAASMVPKSWLNLHKYRKKDESLSAFSRRTIKLVPIDDSPKMNPDVSLIVMGASTGGTMVIEKVLSKLDHRKMPPIAVVQHIPPFFSKSFADRLNKLFPFNVYEAENGKLMLPGDVIIAQGGKHLLVQKAPNGFAGLVKEGPKVNRHQPSVDVLFKSAAIVYRSNVIGVLMTGMGSDGAAGMVELKKNGAVTIAQDRYECAVAGMPRSAIDLGVVDKELDSERIADYLNSVF